MVTLLTLATLPPGTAKQHHPLSTVSPVSKVLPIQRDVTGRDGLSAELSLSPAVETAICATRAGRCSGMSRTWSRSRVIRTQCDKDSRAGGQATNWAGDARHWSIRNPNDAVHVLSSRAVNDTMPQPPITAMHRPRATAVGRAAKLLDLGHADRWHGSFIPAAAVHRESLDCGPTPTFSRGLAAAPSAGSDNSGSGRRRGGRTGRRHPVAGTRAETAPGFSRSAGARRSRIGAARRALARLIGPSPQVETATGPGWPDFRRHAVGRHRIGHLCCRGTGRRAARIP